MIWPYSQIYLTILNIFFKYLVTIKAVACKIFWGVLNYKHVFWFLTKQMKMKKNLTKSDIVIISNYYVINEIKFTFYMKHYYYYYSLEC